MTSRTVVTVNGVRSPVLQAGPTDASEAVVFVHGNPGPSDDWNDLLGRVGSFARAIAPDLPGYGDADKPRDFDYTVAGYARHLAGVLDQLGVQRAHLVLHDFGGAWGLAWAAQHPDALASATLLGTGVFIDYRWHHWARIWRTPILGELFMATATRWALRLLIGRENPRLSRDDVDRLCKSWLLAEKRAVLKLYPRRPRVSSQRPPARCEHSTVQRWSCGRLRIVTFPPNRPNASDKRPHPHESNSLTDTATGFEDVPSSEQ